MDVNSFSSKLSEIEESLSRFIPEQKSRLLQIEQKLTAPRGGGGGYENDNVGGRVVSSEEFKRFAASPNIGKSGRIEVGSLEMKTNLLNATGLNQPLVPPYFKPGIIMPGQMPLRVRDLLPSTPISSNMVVYAKESSSTNAAAPQTAEGALKAESALAFELQYAAVQTLAHFIPVSKQLLEDAPAIQGYINQRLLFFLKLVEDFQLLNGDGTGTNLSGLLTNSTPMDTSLVNPASDTYIDVLGEAITQCSQSFLPVDGIVLHPKDWSKIQRTKTVGTASSGQYIFADPHAASTPTLWGLPVATSWQMNESEFLVGAFAMSAMIWDRNNATIEISREHSDYFVRNLAAILVEERLALTVFRSDGLIHGGFPTGS